MKECTEFKVQSSRFRVRPSRRLGSRFKVRAFRRCAAFTLIELLTAMAILLMIVAMLAAAFNAASTAWRGSERDIERFQQARATLDLIARDLTQTLVSINVPFYANNNSLAFVATVNDDPNSVEMAEIVYRPNTFTAPFTLNRRFTGSASAGPTANLKWDFYNNLTTWPEPASVDSVSPVCDNVVSFSVQCYDNAGNPTPSYWNSTATKNVWPEVGGGGLADGTPAMLGLPPAYIDVHLGVIDSKTATLVASLTNSPAAVTNIIPNIIRQARRDFNIYVKIPQR